MKYTTSQKFTAHFSREPRRTDSASELKKIYARYKRMGFSDFEARSKTYHYHTYKL